MFSREKFDALTPGEKDILACSISSPDWDKHEELPQAQDTLYKQLNSYWVGDGDHTVEDFISTVSKLI